MSFAPRLGVVSIEKYGRSGDDGLTFHVRRFQKNRPNVMLTNELPDLRRDDGTLKAHLMKQ